MPKRETPMSKYVGVGPNIYVLTVKVIDDVFDSCDEDTILVRHCKSIYNDYSEYKDMKALLTVRPKASIQRADSVQYIYLLGGPDDLMFVDDKGIIYDPNSVLNEDFVTYTKLKSDVLEIISEK